MIIFNTPSNFSQFTKIELNKQDFRFKGEICNYLIKNTNFFSKPFRMELSDKNIIILQSIDSTNIYAMELVKNKMAKHGLSVFAVKQTTGKGRSEKRWDSAPGANILLSVITNMDGTSIARQPYFSMWAALCAAQLIERTTDLKAFVKWPNDIFINDKKAGGILIENIIKGSLWQWAITGFGININQERFAPGYRATSLKLETGKSFDVIGFAGQLKDAFLSGLTKRPFQQPALLFDQYNSKLYKRGARVKLQAGNRVFQAVIKGVNERGMLITHDAFEREWQLGEVKMKL